MRAVSVDRRIAPCQGEKFADAIASLWDLIDIHTNNQIEGGNARRRAMLIDCRGLNIERRINPFSAKEL